MPKPSKPWTMPEIKRTYIGLRQIGARLGIDPETVRRQLAAGKLPIYIKPNRKPPFFWSYAMDETAWRIWCERRENDARSRVNRAPPKEKPIPLREAAAPADPAIRRFESFRPFVS